MIALRHDPSPVPRPSRPSRMGNRYIRFSQLLGRYLSLESRLEYEASLLLEWNQETIIYCEQPDLPVFAVVDGETRASRPDFWVRETGGGNVVVEVKYDRELEDPTSRARKQILTQQIWCKELGYEHRVLSCNVIWRNPVLINSLRTLFAAFREGLDCDGTQAAAIRAEIIGLVSSNPGAEMHEIEQRVARPERQLVHAVACDLLRRRKIEAHIDRREFSPRSRLFLGRLEGV